MDPEVTLAKIRELYLKLNSQTLSSNEAAPLGQDLAEHIEALDEWIINGGFLPEVWRRP